MRDDFQPIGNAALQVLLRIAYRYALQKFSCFQEFEALLRQASALDIRLRPSDPEAHLDSILLAVIELPSEDPSCR